MNLLLLTLLLTQTRQQPVPFTSITHPYIYSTPTLYVSVMQLRDPKTGSIGCRIAVTFPKDHTRDLNGSAVKVFENVSKHTLLVLGRVQRADEAGKRVHGVRVRFEGEAVKITLDGKLLAAE